jgi:hypothetical protein
MGEQPAVRGKNSKGRAKEFSPGLSSFNPQPIGAVRPATEDRREGEAPNNLILGIRIAVLGANIWHGDNETTI